MPVSSQIYVISQKICLKKVIALGEIGVDDEVSFMRGRRDHFP